MEHPVCATMARVGAGLCMGALLGLSCAHAAPGSTSLPSELARNAALPRAPLLVPGPARPLAALEPADRVITGGKDELVEVEAVADYVARLQELGKPVSLLVDPDEGHNARNPLARKAQIHLLLRMMHLYLGAPPPPKPDAALGR